MEWFHNAEIFKYNYKGFDFQTCMHIHVHTCVGVLNRRISSLDTLSLHLFEITPMGNILSLDIQNTYIHTYAFYQCLITTRIWNTILCLWVIREIWSKSSEQQIDFSVVRLCSAGTHLDAGTRPRYSKWIIMKAILYHNRPLIIPWLIHII